MRFENYNDALQSFDWLTVQEALGWVPGEKVSLGNSIVDRHAVTDKVALICIDRDGNESRLSYRELSEKSNRFANLLRQLGVEVGDRVAGLMPRGPEVVIAIIGTLKAGAVYVPIFTGFGPDSIQFRLEHCQARILVTHQDVTKQLPPGLNIKTICVSQPQTTLRDDLIDFARGLQQQSAAFNCVRRARDDIAVLIYTSGSTGDPKGGAIAVNFLASVWPYVVYGLDLRSDDIIWPTGDPGWGYGFVCYLTALAAGATVISVQQNPTAELCLSILQRYRVTNLATTPTLLRSLLVLDEEVLRSASVKLHALSSCGEPLNAKVVESFQRLWGVTPMDHFGATEFAIPVGNFNAITMNVKAGSMGLPFPGFTMAIVNEEGVECAVGVIGLIGERMDPDCRYWTSYWRDPAASSELVRRGWIVTGDLGRRDEDGYFWFEGRAGDMIKSAGYRIGPFEVESALLKHPGVAEAAVVGKPDKLRGEIVKAFVVLRPSVTANEELAQELTIFVKQTIGGHQMPRAIEFVDHLPKTETGKIQRFALRERA